MNALAPVATLAAETEGWTYKENRDLTGFIDGTENPSLSEAPEVAIVQDGRPGAGGSVVLVQKWIQHAPEWDALPVEQQERIMGRTKPDGIEIPDDVRAPSAHVSCTVIEEDGEERAIFRRNTPFGTPREHGTMFIRVPRGGAGTLPGEGVPVPRKYRLRLRTWASSDRRAPRKAVT